MSRQFFSYLSSQDGRIVFGLGHAPASSLYTLEILWPSGQTQKVSGLAPSRYHTFEEPGKRQS
ncbi:MAG TPA: ASPIC/UnbV domain-containing protein [Terriglobia bacterium]|nr:ASPIC/UnbV domain-containing protein [Terriglobia bacterium]